MSDATTEATPEEPLVRERHGRVELLRLNRERARNAIDGPTSIALGRALEEIAADDGVWVVVLTGTGDKAFSAGMDLKAFVSGQAGDIMSVEHGFANIARRKFAKPIIAAVNGVALAGGCEIVLSCDLVVAAHHAAFGIPEVKRGLVAAGGGLLRLHQRIPYSIALELALTGETISGAACCRARLRQPARAGRPRRAGGARTGGEDSARTPPWPCALRRRSCDVRSA